VVPAVVLPDFVGGSGYFGWGSPGAGLVLSPDRAIVAMVGVDLSRALLRRVGFADSAALHP
jgi:hypothetical protein